MRPLKSLLILAAVIISSSCSTIATVPELPIPPDLVLPKIDSGSLECLSDDAYSNLVRRDRLLQQRIQTLINIIRSTND
jgi:hypothetical protein